MFSIGDFMSQRRVAALGTVSSTFNFTKDGTELTYVRRHFPKGGFWLGVPARDPAAFSCWYGMSPKHPDRVHLLIWVDLDSDDAGQLKLLEQKARAMIEGCFKIFLAEHTQEDKPSFDIRTVPLKRTSASNRLRRDISPRS